MIGRMSKYVALDKVENVLRLYLETFTLAKCEMQEVARAPSAPPPPVAPLILTPLAPLNRDSEQILIIVMNFFQF